MSKLNISLRNLQDQASKLTPNQLTLADGSTASFGESLMALGDVFGLSEDYAGQAYLGSFAAQSV